MFDKIFKLKVYSDNKESAQKILAERQGEERFFVTESSPISSLSELANSLEQMDPAKYLYHANQERNDFASWVRSVLLDGKLADHLLKAKNQKQALQFCRRRLEELQEIINK